MRRRGGFGARVPSDAMGWARTVDAVRVRSVGEIGTGLVAAVWADGHLPAFPVSRRWEAGV